jgi:hypothetical protein
MPQGISSFFMPVLFMTIAGKICLVVGFRSSTISVVVVQRDL